MVKGFSEWILVVLVVVWLLSRPLLGAQGFDKVFREMYLCVVALTSCLRLFGDIKTVTRLLEQMWKQFHGCLGLYSSLLLNTKCYGT
jgi:hypothetical protein